MYNSKGDIVLELKNGYGGGKEYDFWNNLIYVGNYVDGSRNGNVKLFNEGNKIYEGRYEYGKKHGNGKEYNKFGNLIFKGKYEYGKASNGKLMEYYKDKLLFEAEFNIYSESGTFFPRQKISIIIKDSEDIFNLSSKEYYF